MEETLGKKVGIAVRKARVRRGWSQADAAEQIGISVEFYARIERGRTMPSVPTLVAMADALQVTADELLGRAGPARRAVVIAEATSKDVRLLMRRVRGASPKTVRLLNLLAVALEE